MSREAIDRYCNDRNPDIAARLQLFLDVLAAIGHAHTNLIVHRDSRPNLTATVDADHPMLLQARELERTL
jgi:eukaryotic-like serine/threonine-protein kinase